jgi:hypothetical protein
MRIEGMDATEIHGFAALVALLNEQYRETGVTITRATLTLSVHQAEMWFDENAGAHSIRFLPPGALVQAGEPDAEHSEP